VGTDERLEQRVRTLEYELKILKNEIQRTLLDIQEQLLIHYYPALRASESIPASEVVQSLGAVREKRETIVEAPPISEAPELEIPQVRKVSLGDIRRVREDLSETAVEADHVQGPQPAQPNLIALMGWISSALPKIGKDRAARLLETVHQKGYLDDETKRALMEFFAISGGDKPVERVVPSDLLAVLLKLSELLGRGTNVEEALAWIDEAKLG